LLPRWRGAAPIVWAVADGDAVSGVCLMQMEAGLDTGPVLASQQTPIKAHETAGDLHNRLAQLGGNLLVHSMPELLEGALTAQPQNDDAATYARKLRREDGLIDWGLNAVVVDRRIRAFNPYPGCVASLDEQPIKIWRSVLVDDQRAHGEPGAVIEIDEEGIVVACGEGSVRLLELQRPGRGRVEAADFVNAWPVDGKRFANGS
jgi:methionyl-tRNA formyltransferase